MTESTGVELAPGYRISRVINGCWQLSAGHGGGPTNEAEALKRFAALVDAGFTTFDCADIYTGVESLLGRFRRSLPDPETIQVHTKLVPNRAALPTLTDAAIDAAIDRSRRRLGMERLDLVQFHWWDYAVPGLQRMADRLVEAQAAGRIRCLGVTNFDTDHVMQLQQAGIPLVSLQAQYSLLDRRPEPGMAALAAASGPRLLAYGALAGGFLSERYLGSEPPPSMNRSLAKYRLIIEEAGGWAALQDLLQVLAQVAGRQGATLSGVAARWVLDQTGVAAVILGVGRRARVDERLALGRLQLDRQDRQHIAAALGQLRAVPGDMYALEREPEGVHGRIIKTDLNAG